MEPAPHLSPSPLESARLVLEPLRVQHAHELAPVLQDVALHQFIGGKPASVQELRRRFERQARGRSPDGRDCWLNWAVRQRTTGHAVGTVQATVKTSERAVVAELAWIIGTTFQRQGFAKEAVGVVAAWLMRQRVDCLQARIHPQNAASMAVARSIGLLPTQTIVDGEREWRSSNPG
jgi:RimJ/RimL family protein N-acetyltransferase